jgi:RHS repeat-associated protein
MTDTLKGIKAGLCLASMEAKSNAAPGIPGMFMAKRHRIALYYHRARYYDPQARRFISEDPIGLKGGINLYGYVGNSPIGRTDPSGLFWQELKNFIKGKGWNRDIDLLKPHVDVKVGYGEISEEAAGSRIRLPDLYSGSISFTIPTPLTGNALSWTLSSSIDRYGNCYYSPIGPGFGRAWTGISGSLTANYMLQRNTPTESELKDSLSGHSVSIAGGWWVGGNGTYSPSNGKCFLGGGFVTPQLGANYSYTYEATPGEWNLPSPPPGVRAYPLDDFWIGWDWRDEMFPPGF